MLSLPQALDLAMRHHQAGDLPQAEQLYRQILQVDPRDVNALHLLGLVAHQLGRHDCAVEMIGRALQLRPDSAEAHTNLGTVLFAQGKRAEAVASFRRALSLKPHYTEARRNLAISLQRPGSREEAAAHNQRGIALFDRGRYAEAAACYQQALDLQPDLAAAHSNLGNALAAQGKREEAVACYRTALGLAPDFAHAHTNLGLTLAAMGRHEEAAACFRRAIDLQPEFAEAHSGLGDALAGQELLEESLACYRRALALKPGLAEAHNNLGIALDALGRTEEAQACYRRVLDIRPGDPEAHFNLGMGRLLLGDFEQGWPAYEWRWQCKDFPGPSFSFRQPPWDGSPLEGRTILLHAEQGLGDTLQFIRYAPLVKQRGGTVLVYCQKPLVRLLAGCPGIDRLVPRGAVLTEHCDVHAPLLSLPRIFGTTLATIPAQVPYLVADPGLVGRWRERLGPLRGLRVGIAWQGSPRYPGDRQRSIPLEQFAPLAGLEGVRLISLQKGPGSEQVGAVAGRFPVTDLGRDLDEAAGPFMDTAAVMMNLDLVIGADTAIIHLAGALGVPAWAALPFAAHWPWLLQREDSPWYPTMRLFRQAERGDWHGVFERMTDALKAMLARGPRTPPITVEISPGELLDKISLLEIKGRRLTDAATLVRIRAELAALRAACDRAVVPGEELRRLTAGLRAVHEALWEVEDAIRACERDGDFGPRFIELARSVYRHNDRRAALQRRINALLGSKVGEE